MAIAGRVAIVPKGDWTAVANYEKLDLVKYDGDIFLARKASLGVTPQEGEYWMLMIKGDATFADKYLSLSGGRIGNGGSLIVGYEDGYENNEEVVCRTIINDTVLRFEDTDGWWGDYGYTGARTKESFFNIDLWTDQLIYFFNATDFIATKSVDLGKSYYKWNQLYATNGTIQTSDRNEKSNVADMTADQAEALIYGLKPSTYQMNNGTSGRTHWGMISQDIEELLDSLGWTSLDFAGFIKSPKVEIEETKDEKGRIQRTEKVIEDEYTYSLRYDEFVAPLIKVVQLQNERIAKLEEKLASLDAQ